MSNVITYVVARITAKHQLLGDVNPEHRVNAMCEEAIHDQLIRDFKFLEQTPVYPGKTDFWNYKFFVDIAVPSSTTIGDLIVNASDLLNIMARDIDVEVLEIDLLVQEH